jgi:hypothetical protein
MVALLDRGQTGDFEKCCHAGGALLLFALGWLRRRKPPSAPGSFTAHPVPLSGSTSPNSRPMPPRHGRGATEPPRPKSKLPSAASGTGRPAPRGPDSGRCSNAPHLSSSKMRNACPGCCAAPSARLRASSTRYGGALLIRGPLCTRIALGPGSAVHRTGRCFASPGGRCFASPGGRCFASPGGRCFTSPGERCTASGTRDALLHAAAPHRSSSGCTHRYGVISRVSVSLIMCTGGA